MSSSFRLVYLIGLDLIGPSSQSVLQAPLDLRTLWCYVSVFKKLYLLYFTL